MMDKDDIKAFYKMVGQVEATHDTVKEIKDDLKEGEETMKKHHDRLNALENRNDNIKKNWKRAGWVTTLVAGAWGALKALFSGIV